MVWSHAATYFQLFRLATESIRVWWKVFKVLCQEAGIFNLVLRYKYAKHCTNSASGQISPNGKASNNSLSVALELHGIFCLMQSLGRSFTSFQTCRRCTPSPCGYALGVKTWGLNNICLFQIETTSRGCHPLFLKFSDPWNLMTPWESRYFPVRIM